MKKKGEDARREPVSRVTKAREHLSVETVKDRMQSDPRPFYRRRWLIIYNALVDPRPAEEIARHCGVSKFTVQKLLSRYNRFGERQFLEPFVLRAQAGEIATAGEIHRAFEERLGHNVDESTIYRVLQRHGWRKIVPRPRHPKAQKEAQETFKKNFPSRFKPL
jgi:transposase